MQAAVYAIGILTVVAFFMAVVNRDRIAKLKKKGGGGTNVFESSAGESLVLRTPAGVDVPKQAFLVRLTMPDSPLFSAADIHGDDDTPHPDAVVAHFRDTYDGARLRAFINDNDHVAYVYRSDRRHLFRISEFETNTADDNRVPQPSSSGMLSLALVPLKPGTTFATENDYGDKRLVTIVAIALYRAEDLPTD